SFRRRHWIVDREARKSTTSQIFFPLWFPPPGRDKETGRQGDRERAARRSPGLLVSPSPCLLWRHDSQAHHERCSCTPHAKLLETAGQVQASLGREGFHGGLLVVSAGRQAVGRVPLGNRLFAVVVPGRFRGPRVLVEFPLGMESFVLMNDRLFRVGAH